MGRQTSDHVSQVKRIQSGASNAASDSASVGAEGEWLPIHEGEYGSQYDHRYATYEANSVRAVTLTEHCNPEFEPRFELVASAKEYESIVGGWADMAAPCLLAFRRVSNSGNDRTSICTLLPRMPCTYGWIIVTGCNSQAQALLCANFNSLVFDYLLRSNLSQPSIPQSTFQQMPTPPRRGTLNRISLSSCLR